MDLKINHQSTIPKYQQIVDSLTRSIEGGQLRVGDKLPSINQVSSNNKVAKETVVQAYRQLKLNGIIDSSEKRGFYIQTTITEKRWRVMVLFNIMSPSKEIIYHSIQQSLGEKAHLELFFHNYNFETFENIIRSKAAMFHYFIVMPHYHERLEEVLQIIPAGKLIIIDRPIPQPIEGVSSVHQNFKEDVFDALMKERIKILKYKRIVVLFQKDKNLPPEIVEGIRHFARRNKISINVTSRVEKSMLVSASLFIALTDDMLIQFLELQQESRFLPGKGLGIISYNDSPLKRILAGGITTLSSDFEQMGKTVANIILKQTSLVVRNPFHLRIRSSI